MNRKRKILIIGAGGILILALLGWLFMFIISSPYRNQIPPLPEMESLSIPLQEKLSQANRKARRNPNADNLGILGMIYHSSANYEKAKVCYQLAIKKNRSKWHYSYFLGYLNKEMGESAMPWRI
jgi:tetratricopeptide (TPR) repeat protein